MMVKVKFKGVLEDEFGQDSLEFDVLSVAEIVRALSAQVAGFCEKFEEKYIAAFVEGVGCAIDDLHAALKEGATVVFAPILRGASKGGLWAIVAGAALIAASFVLPVFAGAAFQIGLSLALSGAAALFAPTQDIDQNTEGPQSSAFSGSPRQAKAGGAVPIVLGETAFIVSGTAISASIEVVEG